MPNPIDLNPDIAVGITLPLTVGRQGYFNQSYTTIEQAKSNLQNLLLTIKGERPFNPEFGSDLYSLLFEPMTDDLKDLITVAIESAVEEWMSYIDIKEVIVNWDEEADVNNVDISIEFSLANDALESDILSFSTTGGGR